MSKVYKNDNDCGSNLFDPNQKLQTDLSIGVKSDKKKV